jgi:hypothetical protein
LEKKRVEFLHPDIIFCSSMPSQNPLLSAAAKKISPASNSYIEEMEMALLQFPLHHTLKLALAALEYPILQNWYFFLLSTRDSSISTMQKYEGFVGDGQHPHSIRNSGSKM